MSSHRTKPTNRGTLTPWRWQKERLVRTWNETNRARHTDILETAEGGTCHDTERNRQRKAHSLSGDGRGRDLSGHRKHQTERGTLTSWRRHREGLVRKQKENDQARRTHQLEKASRGTCQDMERNRLSKVHSHSGDGRWRELSGHGKKLAEQGTLTSWRR